MFKHSRVQAGGFTLIEVMIVVVVISILAAVAFPSYMEQTRKSKRVQGKAKLVEVAQKLERYYTDNSTYNTALGPLYGLGSTAAVYAGDNNPSNGPYRISIAAPAGGTLATGYVLTATDNGGSCSWRVICKRFRTV